MNISRSRFEPIVFPLLAFGITGVVFAYYASLPAPSYYREELVAFLQWNLPRPYVYRVLTILAIQGLSTGFAFLPEWSGLIISFLSLLGFVGAFWFLAKRFLPVARAQQITLFAPIALCPFFVYFRHVYDFPLLFLFTAALALLAYGKLSWYLMVLPLVCLTKETAVLLIFFFAVHFRARTREYFGLLAIQVAMFGIIRLVLMWIFRNNPGGDLEFHLADQIQLYAANPIFTAIWFGFWALVIALVAYQFSAKPKFLREAMLTITIPMAILYVFFALPFELRDFYEAFPVLLLLCVPPRLAQDQKQVK